MFCRTCGYELVTTAAICPRCGTPTKDEQDAVAQLPEFSTGWKLGGWLGAFVFPIAGVIVGIIAIMKKSYGQGIGMIIVALLMTSFWVGFWEALGAAL